MIKEYKLLMFIIFLQSLISFSNATIVYIAEDTDAPNADSLNICKFDHENDRIEKCIQSKMSRRDDHIHSIGISPITHHVYLTYSKTNLLFSCTTNESTADIEHCSAIVITGGGRELGGMSFSLDRRWLYLADRNKEGIRACRLNEHGDPTNGCPLMREEDGIKLKYPTSVAVTGGHILIGDPFLNALLTCDINDNDATLNHCGKLFERPAADINFKSISDLAYNRNLPNYLFIANGSSELPSMVCGKTGICKAYNFLSDLEGFEGSVHGSIHGSTSVTTSSDGNYAFFVAGSNKLVSAKIESKGILIKKDIEKFYGPITAIAAYN